MIELCIIYPDLFDTTFWFYGVCGWKYE